MAEQQPQPSHTMELTSDLTPDTTWTSYPIGQIQSATIDPDRGLTYLIYDNSEVMLYSIYLQLTPPGPSRSPSGAKRMRTAIVIDREHNRIIVQDASFQRLEVWAHETPPRFERFVDVESLGVEPPNPDADDDDDDQAPFEFLHTHSLALDARRRRLLFVNAISQHIVIMSSVDFAVLRVLSGLDDVVYNPTHLAFDNRLDRLIVRDTDQVRVLAMSDEHGAELPLPRVLFGITPPRDLGRLDFMTGACVINESRIIVCLQPYGGAPQLRAFSSSGSLISILDCRRYFDERRLTLSDIVQSGCPVAFDEARGTLMLATAPYPVSILPNAWLPGTYTWHTRRHALAPRETRRAVRIMLELRDAAGDESTLALVPNEILFHIFEFL